MFNAGGADIILDKNMKSREQGLWGNPYVLGKKRGANEGDYMTCHSPLPWD